MKIWLIYMGLLLYWEIVFHVGCFGMRMVSPWIGLMLLSILASVTTILTGWIEQKYKRMIFWAIVLVEYMVFAAQAVYYTIFRQPLQLQAIFLGAQDALTGYWREMFRGIFNTLPILGILALPLAITAYFFYREKKTLPLLSGIQKIRVAFVLGVSILGYWMTMELGKILDADFYHEYREFYDPGLVAEEMGLSAMIQRDMGMEMEMLAEKMLAVFDAPGDGTASEELAGGDEFAQIESSGEWLPEQDETALDPDVSKEENLTPESEVDVQGSGPAEEITEQEKIIPPYNTIRLDIGKLAELSSGNKEKEWLYEYISLETPTKTNAYTGMFEGYNLIYITAEGFSTYAINEELTPTLYKLANSGFVFTDYYVPLWQTSTSDGEYVNLTGLIPDGQFSMKKTAENNMAYVLPAFFDEEGSVNMAYHNNTLSYYDRHLSHPNLGYDFKASLLGELDLATWEDKIFHMDNPGRWPSSDFEMMQYTIPEYIQADRFNVYYMTVSGHMYYSFTGNSMSSKNRDIVNGLNMSENGRAYIACHVELDKAMEHLLTELEAAGKLENTVIALSADHYPYGMTVEQYEELAGKPLTDKKDMFRNTLILWNGGMKETVEITKPCCSVDILPTLLNLLGCDFDSRMYAGRDILSDAEGLVIFNDRSFVTDTVVYDRKKKTTVWLKDLSEEEKQTYLERMKEEVKDRYNFSAYMLRQNYYDVLKQCEKQ